MTTKQSAKGIEPPADVREAVAALLKSEGEFSAASRLRLSRQTIARVASGMSVNQGTIDAIRFRLGLEEVAS